MKILMVNPIMYSNETNEIKKVKSIKDTLMYNVCCGFNNIGISITLACSYDFKPYLNEEYDFEIKFFKTNFRKICYPKIIPHLKGFKKYCKDNINNFDFVICSEAFSLATYTAVGVFKEKCYIWQEMAKHQKKFKKIPSIIWYNVIVKMFYKNATIIARSKNAREFISKYSKNVSSQIIEHGMNISKFPCVNRQNKKQFIVVSQLIKRKRIDKILYIFKLFLDEYKDYKLIVCGSGDQKNELIQIVKNYGIEKNVVFKGQCKHADLSILYRQSLGLLIYTEQDNNMVSIIESIVSGTPIITTTIPYNTTYIRKYNLGIVNDNWGVKEMRMLINNFDLYSNNCINYRNNLSSENTAKLFYKIFSKEHI